MNAWQAFLAGLLIGWAVGIVCSLLLSAFMRLKARQTESEELSQWHKWYRANEGLFTQASQAQKEARLAPVNRDDPQ